MTICLLCQHDCIILYIQLCLPLLLHLSHAHNNIPAVFDLSSYVYILSAALIWITWSLNLIPGNSVTFVHQLLEGFFFTFHSPAEFNCLLSEFVEWLRNGCKPSKLEELLYFKCCSGHWPLSHLSSLVGFSQGQWQCPPQKLHGRS